jgi:hypothetical protein
MLALAAVWFVAVGGTGDGSAAAPFGSVQAALDVAQPGDLVEVAAGVYTQAIATKRAASAALPITVRGTGGVVVRLAGRVLTVAHPYHVFEKLAFDAQYADADAVRIETAGTGTVLREVEVSRATRDCVDLISPAGVLIENSKIHHCLNAAGGRTDAHGIVGAAVKDLIVRDTEIHTFSGDALQFDPDRLVPQWDNVLVENCTLYLVPLPAPENGFAAGAVPGENAIDTKVPAGMKSRLTVRNTTAYGFRGGLIGNMAAFNLKEGVVAELDRVTIYASEIGLRLRAPAEVRVQNAVIYDATTAVRYEDNIVTPKLYSSTIGRDVTTAFVEASSDATVFDAKNVLVLAAALPPEVTGLAVDASVFRDAANHDYRLVEGTMPIDRGVTVDVTTDRDGVERPQGSAHDVGAFEFCPGACAAAPDGGGDAGTTGGGTDSGGCCQSGRGPAWPALLLVAFWLRRRRSAQVLPSEHAASPGRALHSKSGIG